MIPEPATEPAPDAAPDGTRAAVETPAAGPSDPIARRALAVAGFAAIAFAACLPWSIAGTQIAWGIALLALVVATVRGAPGLERTPLDAPIVLHLSIIGLSLVFAWVRPFDPQEAFDGWRFLALFALAPVLVRDRRTAARVLVAFVAAATVISIYGIVQRYTGVDLARSAAHAIRPRSNFQAGLFRPTGAFDYYTTFALLLSGAIGFAAAAFLELARTIRARIVLAAALVVMVLALAFTEVRAAWLGLLLGLAVGAFQRNRRTVVVMAAIATVAAGGLVVAFPGVRAKAESTFRIRYNHNDERVFMWARALEMTGDAPATGIGQGHWRATADLYLGRTDAPFPTYAHAHDALIHWWATTGPVGVLAIVWLFVVFLRLAGRAYRRAREKQDRLAATLALASIIGTLAYLGVGLAWTPYFKGILFYMVILCFAAGLAAARWTGAAALERPSREAVLGVAVPVVLALLVGFTQPGWDPSLGAAGIFTGAGSSIRIGVLFALAGALFFLFIFRSLRRRLREDPFAWSLGITAVLLVLAWIAVAQVLAPAAGVPTTAGPWIPATAVTMLAAAFTYRLLLRSPLGWPGLVGVSLVAIAAGAMTHGIESPEVKMLPWAKSGPVVVGRDDRVKVDSLPAGDRRRRDAAAVVGFGSGILGERCHATVLGGRAILTSDRCAGTPLPEVLVAGRAVRCIKAEDRVPGADLAALRCRAAGKTTDLVDLAGANLTIDPVWPKNGDAILRVTRTEISPCTVTRVEGNVLFDDCDGTGEPGAPLVSARTGRIVGVDLGRTAGGKENQAAVAARILRARDIDHDGVPDGVDDCLRYDPTQSDSDRDGVGDACTPVLGAAPAGGGMLVGYTSRARIVRMRIVERAMGPALEPVAAPLFDGVRHWAGIGAGDLGAGPAIALVSNLDGDVVLLDPHGHVEAKFDFGAESGWAGLAVAHLDGKGSPERIALARNADHRVLVLSLTGGRLAVQAYLVDAKGGDFRTLVATDLDGDGTDEIVTARGGHGVAPSLVVYTVAGRKIERRESVAAPGGVAIQSLATVKAGGHTVVMALGADGVVRVASALLSGGTATPDEGTGAAGVTLAGGARWIAAVGPGRLVAYRRRDPAVVPLFVSGPPIAVSASPAPPGHPSAPVRPDRPPTRDNAPAVPATPTPSPAR